MCIFLIFIFLISIQSYSFAKYVIEKTILVAKLDINKSRPKLELIDITSNAKNPNLANKDDIITGHIRLTEDAIYRNILSIHTIIVLIDNKPTNVIFKKFTLISNTGDVRIYEFSFTNVLADGSLSILIPEGTVEDKSGSINFEEIFSTNIKINNSNISL